MADLDLFVDSDLDSETDPGSLSDLATVAYWRDCFACCVYCLLGLWIDVLADLLLSWGIKSRLEPQAWEVWLEDNPIDKQNPIPAPKPREALHSFEGCIVLN